MKDVICIREYREKDKTTALNLLKLNTPKFFSQKEEADFNYYLDNEKELYYVLEFRGKMVGCGGINITDRGTIGKISWDILHPEYQKKSLGSCLLRYRIDKLNAMETIKEITVRTSQFAYKFYEKQGFELLEIVKNYWTEGFDLYSMRYKR